MPAGSRQLILAATLLALPACAASTPQVLQFRDERVGPCTDKAPCELAGVLTLQSEPGATATASIDQVQGPCVPLLLPEPVAAAPGRWQGRRVRVTGTALARSSGPAGVTRVRYRDRWLLEGVCGRSDVVVYVDAVARE